VSILLMQLTTMVFMLPTYMYWNVMLNTVSKL